MTKQQYQEKINELLFSMVGEDVVHDNFGIGTIMGFVDNKCIVKYDKFDENKFMSIERFFDYNMPILQKTQDNIDAIKVEYELSKESDTKKTHKVNSKAVKGSNVKQVTFEDVIGLDDVKELVNTLIVNPFKYKEIYRIFNRESGGGILLYGAPGNGKTLIAKAIANEVDAKFYSIKCSDITSKWYGESERKIKELFESAKENEKSIIFFDEFDALGSSRDNKTLGSNNRIVSELLSQIDGFDDDPDSTILVMASTNKPWNIDEALIRSGRFSKKIYVGLPDSEARSKLFEHALNKVPHEDLDLATLASLSDGCSNADIVEICNEAKDKAIKRSITSGVISKVSNKDLNDVVSSFNPTVSKRDLARLMEYK